MTVAPGEVLALYSVEVALHDPDSATLLSVVSALHRRHVDVRDARLTRPADDRAWFEATVLTTARQARTVEATLRNLVQAGHVRVAACPAVRVEESA